MRSMIGRSSLRALVMLTLAGLIAPLLSAPPGVAAGSEPSARAAIRVPRPTWNPCHRVFECSRVWVPLDYDHPNGTKISLALMKLPASNPAAKIGSIFLNPGGPGGSGVDFVRFAGPALFSARTRARFDLVGFDPRGVFRSTPLRCFDTLDEAFQSTAPMVFPVGHREERVWIRADRTLARACATHGGPILDHMSTADVARDMNLLRRAVRDDQLTYFGISYGSMLGQTYANLFPDKVRALVIDGVLDPVDWSTGRAGEARRLPFSTRLSPHQGSFATLNEFFRLCDQGGKNCAFSKGNPRKRYAQLARRLRAHPARLPDGQGGTFRVTYADLVDGTYGALTEPSSWAELAEILQQLDSLDDPAAAAASLRSLRVRLAAQQEEYPNFVEGFPGVACPDTDNPATIGAWKRAAAEADRDHPYFGRPWTWLSSICQAWPGKAHDRYMGPFTRWTSNPVLVIGNRFDPATPYQGAVTASKLLPRSRLLTLDGWGHTALFLSTCIDGYLSRYLLTLELPPDGMVCRPDLLPFAQSTSRARKAIGASLRSIVVPTVIRST